jgi:succinate dehydrogenase/fumarate reductase-like Fe-S protein
VKINLRIWRQSINSVNGEFKNYIVDNVFEDMSFFEMLDMLNNTLIQNNQTPIAFDHDCREGICGTCGVVINGTAHGPLKGITTCQLHMRSFKDGDTLVVEPWRASSFPIIKDLVVDRTSFDRIMESGDIFQLKLEGPQMPIQSLFLKKIQMKHLILRHALDAEHVLLHAKTHQLCYLLEQKLINMHNCHKGKLNIQKESMIW